MLAEGHGYTEDIDPAGSNAVEDVLQRDAELHVHQMDLTEQRGAGRTC